MAYWWYIQCSKVFFFNIDFVCSILLNLLFSSSSLPEAYLKFSPSMSFVNKGSFSSFFLSKSSLFILLLPFVSDLSTGLNQSREGWKPMNIEQFLIVLILEQFSGTEYQRNYSTITFKGMCVWNYFDQLRHQNTNPSSKK